MSYLYLGITLLFFSLLEVVSKPLMGLVDPYFMTFFRFLTGGLFLSLFIRKRLPIKEVLSLTLIGTLNAVISMTLLQLSIKLGNASTAAVLIASNPIFVAAFAPLIARERINRKKYIGIFIGLAGIGVFISGKIIGDTFAGIITGVGAAITFALYAVLMKRHISQYGALNCTAYSTIFPSLIYGALLLVTRNFNFPTLDFSGWMIMLFMGVGITGIAYFTFFRAAEKIGAATASRVFYLKPVAATLLAVLFLGESVGVIKIVGMIIIIISLFI